MEVVTILWVSSEDSMTKCLQKHLEDSKCSVSFTYYYHHHYNE